jgi:hypothetical protein
MEFLIGALIMATIMGLLTKSIFVRSDDAGDSQFGNYFETACRMQSLVLFFKTLGPTINSELKGNNGAFQDYCQFLLNTQRPFT